MKLSAGITIKRAAEILNCEFVGDENHLITGINEIHKVSEGDLTFVDVEKYYAKALNSAATTVLINKKVETPEGKALLISEEPFDDYNKLNEALKPTLPVSNSVEYSFDASNSIGNSAFFGENVELGKNNTIGHNVTIGNNVKISDNNVIYPNVYIADDTVIGNNVCIQAGAIIGGEAFYFKSRPHRKDKMISKGRTIIHDNVDIGAGTTIDKGVSHDTIIGEFTKIDNLVQIGHDTVLGKRCTIAAQVGIAGVVTIGDDVNIWGQAGITQNTAIPNKVNIMAKTGVMSDLESGKTYAGMVAMDVRLFWKIQSVLRKLPEMYRKFLPKK